MKKILLCAALVLSLALVLGCKSTPKETSTDDEFKKVYDEHRGALILDGAETYIVVKGDALNKIARKRYHDGFYYPVIMLASSDVVLDPDKIEPGMELIIPDLQKNLEDATARASIKEFLIKISAIEEERGRSNTAMGLHQLAEKL